MGFGIITPTTPSSIDRTLAFQQVLSLCGLVQTGDTGQWSTSKNGPGTYLMYRFNDALSTTYPIYLKFTPLIFSSTIESCTKLDSIGFATNGAGTITGSKHTFGTNTGDSSLLFSRILYSYTNSGVFIVFEAGGGGSSVTSLSFCVERALNQDGTISDSQGEIGCFLSSKGTSTMPESITLKPNGFKDAREPYYPILGNNTYVTNTGLSTVMPYYFFGESRPWQSNLMSVGNKLANIGWNCITNGTSKYYQQQATTHSSVTTEYYLGRGHLPGMLWE